MSERAPIQVTAPASYDGTSFSRKGDQLSLLPVASEPMPVAPSPGTLAARMLGMLAAGEAIDHPAFERRTGSWRAAAWIFELRSLGWSIEAEGVPAPAPDRPDRTIARYRLDGRQIDIARGTRSTRGVN
jgi:hypothetical protein